MDFDKLKEFLRTCSQDVPMQIDVPSVLNMSFIPREQLSNVLVMKSKQPRKENMSTAFIGVLRSNYIQPMWHEDVQKWKNHFGQNQPYYEIPLLPIPQHAEVLDSSDAILKIEQALKDMNELPPDVKIRVVCLGTGYSNFLYDALTYLLKEWKNPDGTLRKAKHMQFVTSGDTSRRDLSNFCQWLCISDTCQTVEFYNTHVYHPFGFCSAEYTDRQH